MKCPQISLLGAVLLFCYADAAPPCGYSCKVALAARYKAGVCDALQSVGPATGRQQANVLLSSGGRFACNPPPFWRTEAKFLDTPRPPPVNVTITEHDD